jgi:hypothetical protein
MAKKWLNNKELYGAFSFIFGAYNQPQIKIKPEAAMLFYESSRDAGFLAKYFESIASNIPFLLFFLLNYGNNYWMSCLYNTIDRIANYINSLEGGRSSKINEAYE